MKARIEDDGQIKIYNELPSQFRGVTGNYIGGFHLADPAIHKEEGFFDVVIPNYNHVLEILSPIYFNEENKVFTYKVEQNPNLPTLDQAKIDKIAELKNNGREKFAETDWYYTRELRMKELGVTKEVPPDVVSKTRDLYALLDEREKEINALSSLEAVLTFSASLEEGSEQTSSVLKEKVKDPSSITEADLSAYTVALLAVKKEDYTSESWATYQSILDANIVTVSNTQLEVDTAVANIKAAQSSLKVLDKNFGAPSASPDPVAGEVATTPAPKTEEPASLVLSPDASTPVISTVDPALKLASTSISDSAPAPASIATPTNVETPVVPPSETPSA